MKEEESRIGSEIAGVLAVACAALLSISLVTYNQADPSFNSYLSDGGDVVNSTGIVGAWASDLLIQSSGALAWLTPLGFLYLGISLVRGTRFSSLALFGSGLTLLYLSVAALFFIGFGPHDPLFRETAPGGMIGRLVAERLTLPWLATSGSAILLSALAVASLLMMARLSLAGAAKLLIITSWRAWRHTSTVARKTFLFLKSITIPIFLVAGETGVARMKQTIAQRKSRNEADDLATAQEALAALADEDFDNPAVITFPTTTALDITEEEEALSLPPGRGETTIATPKPKEKKKKKETSPEEVFQQEIFALSTDGSYQFPPLNLLDAEPPVILRQSKDDLLKSSRILEKKLADFGVDGKVTQVLPGPVITIFEFAPAPGVKVSRIVNLSDDLAMSLRALSIRIVAPIPGKSVVGIEIPNVRRESVFLKEILASEEFQEHDAGIPMALGSDISGQPVTTDLASVPHLLIAGSTGSGKSVGINAMICSILYRLTPSEVKFIMIDPKMLELSIYDGIPHLIAPVVTNPKKAANALKWVVGEMERRYTLLSDIGVRNITSYNKLVEANLKELAKKGITAESALEEAELKAAEGEEVKNPLVEKLPFIVVVIDELADLMLVASKDVEDSLARLAQMARAAGIHLIVATQRPSVDVLTGLIKANFPARISFQVRSRVDSRTIIDSMGAEKLLGKGDMLYLPPGASGMSRIQGPFVSDEEIHRVVNFLKEQKRPDYNTDILEAQITADDGVGGDIADEKDEFYHQAVEIVAQTRQASISMIQRRLRIGYNRAARIVEMMELEGLVGPSDGSKPREVFIRDLDAAATEYN